MYIHSTFMLLWCTSSVALELNGSVPFRGVRPRIQISMAETRRSDDYITLTRTQGPTISRGTTGDHRLVLAGADNSGTFTYSPVVYNMSRLSADFVL